MTFWIIITLIGLALMAYGAVSYFFGRRRLTMDE